MDYRKAKYNAAGTIDCEIDHPVFGWIPFTASPDDDTEYGPEIYGLALQGDVAPYLPPAIVVAVPDSVSARQFRMQLRISGLRDAVVTWIATQNELTQDAFEYSDKFHRDDAMMRSGFAALGFTDEQGDEFFIAASKL